MFYRVTNTVQASNEMMGRQTGTNMRPDSQVYPQIFHGLPEKRKLELTRVVAGMAQTQGKLAAQWWLEQQLDAHRSDQAQTTRFGEALDNLQAEGADHRDLTAAEAESVTPSRDQLVAQAPTTLAVLTPEQLAYRKAVEMAEPLTQAQLEHVSAALTPQSCKVFKFVYLYACSHALSKGQSLKAFQISFFLPAETIHLATGVPKRTVYDALRRIKALGLLDHRGHVITLEGYGNRCDGTVFAVKLDTLRGGAARVTYDDLKIDDYRNLGEDIAAERTVYRIAQSETWVGDVKSNLCRVLSWIASKCTRPWDAEVSKPRFMTVQASSKLGLEAVLDVATGPATTRGRRIGAAATAIAGALGDQHSLAFWWKFCDRLASLAENGSQNYSATVVACMQREIAAKTEGFAKNAAALFISRLKSSGVYEEVMTA